MVVKYETVVGQDIGGGITRRILAHNGNMMIVEAVFKKGAVGTAHRHPHEQVSYILSGSFQYTMEEEVYELKGGYLLCTSWSSSWCDSAGRRGDIGYFYTAKGRFFGIKQIIPDHADYELWSGIFALLGNVMSYYFPMESNLSQISLEGAAVARETMMIAAQATRNAGSSS